MGANAVTTVPVYTAGEVLTAADLNITNSGIPVFASTVERDAAFGGTGEKTLAEGQFAFLEDSNSTQFYDGASWQSVGVAPGLVLITTASPSAVSSVSINDCFTSTYENYRVVISLTAISGSTDFNMRLRVGGSDTTSNYVSQLTESFTSSVQTAANPSGTDDWYVGRDSDVAGTTVFDIFRPQTATRTDLIGFGFYLAPTGVYVAQQYFNVQTAATQFDGFTLIKDNNFTGTIRVYGYANS
jgi:hypothetical protein